MIGLKEIIIEYLKEQTGIECQELDAIDIEHPNPCYLTFENTDPFPDNVK